MIKTFKNRQTLAIFARHVPKGFGPDICKSGYKKLQFLNIAINLDDLRLPPSNMFEALHGDRKGQHSIRVNDQFRVCFIWMDGHSYEVEIVDYH